MNADACERHTEKINLGEQTFRLCGARQERGLDRPQCSERGFTFSVRYPVASLIRALHPRPLVYDVRYALRFSAIC
jgi:hypothetical protein